MTDNDKFSWLNKLHEQSRTLSEARMLRDETALTPELETQVIQRLKDLLVRLDKSEAWAAKSMGVSAATLSQVLSGTYGADCDPHIRAIDKWTEAQILRENAPRPAGFVKTSVAEQIYSATRWLQKINAIGLVHGPAGIGKTMALQAIRAETTGSIYCSVLTAGQSKLSVLESLSRAARVSGLKLTSFQIHHQLVDLLKDTNRLIIVDEVHKLAGRQKDDALHALRDLHDATNCPMLWAGMSNIADYIHRGVSTFEPLDQISSRIKLWLDLREAATRADGGPGLHSVEDVKKMIAAAKMRITPDGAGFLMALANEPGQGGLRTAFSLAQMATAVSPNDKAIDATLLRVIRRQQLGARAADQVERQMEMRVKAG